MPLCHEKLLFRIGTGFYRRCTKKFCWHFNLPWRNDKINQPAKF